MPAHIPRYMPPYIPRFVPPFIPRYVPHIYHALCPHIYHALCPHLYHVMCPIYTTLCAPIYTTLCAPIYARKSQVQKKSPAPGRIFAKWREIYFFKKSILLFANLRRRGVWKFKFKLILVNKYNLHYVFQKWSVLWKIKLTRREFYYCYSPHQYLEFSEKYAAAERHHAIRHFKLITAAWKNNIGNSLERGEEGRKGTWAAARGPASALVAAGRGPSTSWGAPHDFW